MFAKLRRKIQAYKYKKCKELTESDNFLYDVDILLFVSLYEATERIERRYQKGKG